VSANPQTLTKTVTLCASQITNVVVLPLTLALLQMPLAGNKNSQQNNIPGKDLLLFWRTHFTKINFKKTKSRKRIEVGGNLLPKCSRRRRDSKVVVTEAFHLLVVNTS
jgi:hypothetical protein